MGSGSPRADAAPTQPQGRPGKHCVASTHGRSHTGERKWDVRGLPEAIFALAVPAWHRTVHRVRNTVLRRITTITVRIVKT